MTNEADLSERHSNGLGVGAIIGIVVGVVVLLLLIAAIIILVCCIQRRKKQQREKSKFLILNLNVYFFNLF